jgi:hypothetical protein
MSRFLYPLISEDASFQTEISLLNSSLQAAAVQLELWGPDGTLDAFVSVSMAPLTSMSKPLSQLFPGMQPHRPGNVRIRSSEPIYSHATLYTPDMTFIATEEPVPYPEP